MKLLLFLLSCASLPAAECVAVNSGRIFARELTGAVPAFSGMDPETVIGFTPLPGVQRVLSARELQAVARHAGLSMDTPVPAVCVERSVRPIERPDLQATLLAALGVRDVRLEIVDYSNTLVPLGRFEFPITGLSKPPADAPDTAVIWHGRLVYDGDRSMAVWAKARITVERPALVATEQIVAGTTFRPEQFKMARIAQFPLAAVTPGTAADVIGKTARRTILAGQAIFAEYLTTPRDVAAGERVHVRVVDGLAALSLEAIAQSAGSKGEFITVRNPASGKTFRGTVEDKGKVVVRPSEGVE